MGLDLSGPHPTSADGDAWLIVFTDRFIRCFLDGLHEKWDTHLDAIELAFNSSQHASTGISPFEAVWFQPTSSP